jgi:hypothetical protein
MSEKSNAERRALMLQVNKEASDLSQDILSIAEYRSLKMPSLIVACAAIVRSIADRADDRDQIFELFMSVYNTEIKEGKVEQ